MSQYHSAGTDSRVVGELLRQKAASVPEVALVKCGADWVSRSTMDSESDRLAAGLSELGVRKGDRVAFLVPNREELVKLFFACAKLGAIEVALNYYLKGEFLQYQLDDCGADVLVVDGRGYPAVERIIGRTGVTRVVLLDEVDGTCPAVSTVPYAELLDAGDHPPAVEVAQHDPLAIIYTSGTTGLPKGCLLPHGYYTSSGHIIGSAWLDEPEDRLITALPFFHAFGQGISLMMALAKDASVCFEEQFSASRFIHRAAEEHATVAVGVGPMGMALLAQPAASSDTAHDLRLTVWPPMPVHSQLEFERRFRVPVICEAYGQTECQPITLMTLGGQRNRASCGRPMPHIDVKIMDDADREVDAGEVGEIVVRPHEPEVMFLGYWNKPEATIAALRNLWHHTGDYARADTDGALIFVDRKKDFIRRRGENVSSVELEGVITRHSAIARAAVVGIPSPLGDNDIKACIVCHPGAEPTVQELFAYFKAELPYFAIPRYIQIRDSLPTTAATDRVMKVVLKEEGVTPDTWDLEALELAVARDDRRG